MQIAPDVRFASLRFARANRTSMSMSCTRKSVASGCNSHRSERVEAANIVELERKLALAPLRVAALCV